MAQIPKVPVTFWEMLWQPLFIRWMPFLLPNQWCQSSKECMSKSETIPKLYENSSTIFSVIFTNRKVEKKLEKADNKK